MADDRDTERLPPWIDREKLFEDVARVVFAHGLTLGQFYSALGVNVSERTLGDTASPINQMAELRKKWTLEDRKR